MQPRKSLQRKRQFDQQGSNSSDNNNNRNNRHRSSKNNNSSGSSSNNNSNNNNNNNNGSKPKTTILGLADAIPPTTSSGIRATRLAKTTVLSLPLNVWLHILKQLPLRHVLTLASVSQVFHEYIFSMTEFWIHVQQKAKCNSHTPSAETPWGLRGLECQQLVMNFMSSLCDYCYSGAVLNVDYDGHKAVLPVRISQDKKDTNSIRRRRYSVYLCGPCRITHFQQHPEPIYEDTRIIELSREDAMAKYCISKKDLNYLWNKKEDNGINRRSDAYIRLYARCIYGGDVGIEAEKQREKHMVKNHE